MVKRVCVCVGGGCSVKNKIFVVDDWRILLLSLMEKSHVSLETKKFQFFYFHLKPSRV